MESKGIALALIITVFVGLALAPRSSAQWTTESYQLKPGWSAIWMSIDTSHQDIDNLLAGYPDIEEIWRWNPLSSTAVFTQSPAQPVQGDVQWFVWKRGFPTDTTMTRLSGNSAYLVKLADSATATTIQLTGIPVPPKYEWSRSGVNFFGFPMQTPPSASDHNFERLLSFSNELSAGPDIFHYDGGPLGATNPKQVTAPRLFTVERGQAYWVRSSQYSSYYGPLQLSISGSGLFFGDTGSQRTFRLTNVTDQVVTATISLSGSAAPPAGQAPLAGAVPLLLRGALDPMTGQFPFIDLSAAPATITLGPGQGSNLVFSVDRSLMGGAAGDVFQSILQVEDSLSISRVDLPVQAVTTSRSGLWVGAAMVSMVDQVTAAPAPQSNGTGSVIVTTDADAKAPSEFPLRLIMHRDDAGTVKLLQTVFLGKNPSGTPVVGTREDLLDPNDLKNARRLTSTTFPLDEKALATGDLGLSGTVTLTSVLAHDASTNPFVHAYHPDHDNRDAQFSPTTLPAGLESPTISRDITFQMIADGATIGVNDLGWGSTTLGGNYFETVSGLRAQPITVKGTFVLYRVSDIPTLSE